MGIKKGWGNKESKVIWGKEEGMVLSRIVKGRGSRDLIIVSIYNTNEWNGRGRGKSEEINEGRERELYSNWRGF